MYEQAQHYLQESTREADALVRRVQSRAAKREKPAAEKKTAGK
jgi:hypothetical protein